HWKRAGINPWTFDKTDDAHGFNGKIFTFVSTIELVVVSIYAFNSEWYNYLLPFWYLEEPILVNIGWGLLIISLILVWIAQSQMSSSWRIGIDTKNKTKLITSGLFSISRNPIFLGIMLANIGVFLVIPNSVTLLILVLSCVSINTQIRLEEAFLKQEFKNEYEAYTSKVRRWL
ncbi:MAG: isoprenylcysteine carboxylmethyltransferase family protein, partial [Bacteroidia bacterium]|nr:isoprenylcysteine carboxylmethyltransferase family protein [Bacteroidia bacterium]